MKLGKKAQYALLFVLYLSRNGRARTQDAAQAMSLSVSFLEQVARKLRQSNIVKSIRGPGGGYELQADPTTGEVLDAVGVFPIMTKSETEVLQRGNSDQRALASLVGGLSYGLTTSLKTSVASQAKALTDKEGKQLDSLGDKPAVN